MSRSNKIKVAVLDDYQGVALQLADWTPLQTRAEISVYHDHLTDTTAIIQRLKPFHVICVMRERTPLLRAILEELPNLKLIASTGPRNASIDLPTAKKLGITVCGTGGTAPAGHGADELTWALILSAVRNLPQELNSVRQGNWQVSVGSELQGKTIGIVGLGRIGGTTARVAKAFGMNVIAWSQNLTRETTERYGAQLVNKEDLFRSSDFISVHLVLSERTRGIIGERELGMMKPSAYLVNTSRGPLIDEKALIDTLKNRRIAGAALDVFDIEPLPADHPLRTLDNVLASPHIGFVTRESYKMFYSQTVENVLAWLDGNPIRKIES